MSDLDELLERVEVGLAPDDEAHRRVARAALNTLKFRVKESLGGADYDPSLENEEASSIVAHLRLIADRIEGLAGQAAATNRVQEAVITRYPAPWGSVRVFPPGAGQLCNCSCPQCLGCRGLA